MSNIPKAYSIYPTSRAEGQGFNPRPRVRGDADAYGIVPLKGKFQSTPPREGRRNWNGTMRNNASFNPRPRVRGDF